MSSLNEDNYNRTAECIGISRHDSLDHQGDGALGEDRSPSEPALPHLSKNDTDVEPDVNQVQTTMDQTEELIDHGSVTSVEIFDSPDSDGERDAGGSPRSGSSQAGDAADEQEGDPWHAPLGASSPTPDVPQDASHIPPSLKEPDLDEPGMLSETMKAIEDAVAGLGLGGVAAGLWDVTHTAVMSNADDTATTDTATTDSAFSVTTDLDDLPSPPPNPVAQATSAFIHPTETAPNPFSSAAARAVAATASAATASAASAAASAAAYATVVSQDPYQYDWYSDSEEDEVASVGTSQQNSSSPGTLQLPGSSRNSSQGTPSTDDPANAAWKRHHKHFFILSSSGKPIFSLHGDDSRMAGLAALITALVSVVGNLGDQLRHIQAGTTLVVMLTRGPLILVACSRTKEPLQALRKQLELLYLQVLLVVTTGLESIILRNPSYDVRGLLEGVSPVLRRLMAHTRHDPTYLTGTIAPYPLPARDRELISLQLAAAVKASSSFYGLIMVDHRVIALERSKLQPAINALDVLLLSNFVTSNRSYRHGPGEHFSPVCLPHYNSAAFLHAYIAYLDPVSGVYLALLAGSSDAFHALSEARSIIETQVVRSGLLRKLKAQLSSHGCGGLQIQQLPRPFGGPYGHSPLWHFMVKFPRRHQLIMPAFTNPHHTPAARRVLTESLATLVSLVWEYTPPPQSAAAQASSASAGSSSLLAKKPLVLEPLAKPHKLVWLRDENRALLAVVDREMEVYCVLDALTDQSLALQAAEWLRRHFGDKAVQADLLLTGV